VIASWAYNEPLTQQGTAELDELDTQLEQTQASMKIAETELERALRIVDAAQAALEKLSEQTESAEGILGSVKGTLDNQLLPGLESARQKIEGVRGALESLQTILDQLNTIPLLNIEVPNGVFQDLIDTADSLDTQIASVQEIGERASTFVGDTAYLLGGDLTETHDNLEQLLTSVQGYDAQITTWRTQLADLQASLPGWIDTASIILTAFLLWFAFSQAGLIVHGLTLWHGGDPLVIARGVALAAPPVPETSAGTGEDV
jgi:DNA repair exonuclease SbcCD ATPase subunit